MLDASEGSRQSSYRAAGVDIDAAEAAKRHIAQRVAATHGPNVLGGIGHFGGFFRAPGPGNRQVLVASADGVGTKVLLAVLVGRHRGIGVDLVNHCVNDILACGALPLFMLDYFATPKLDPATLAEIVDGLAEACEAAGCALIGGETAQLPGIYQDETYDLAGFIVGVVDENRIIDGSAIREGDLIIGIPSSGLHTNGYSLARSALGLGLAVAPDIVRRRLAEQLPDSGRTLADAVLEPHRSYLPLIRPVLDSGSITGMAHITGGGLVDNLARVIPAGLQASIDVTRWETPEIFRLIAERGSIAESEMFRVFNMGIGFVVVARPERSTELAKAVGGNAIGEVRRAEDTQRVRLVGLDNRYLAPDGVG